MAKSLTQPKGFSGGVLILFLVAAFVAGFYLITRSFAAGETGNLWVDANGGSCTRSGTGAVYNDGTACGSLNAALAAATRGDTVYVKGATYGPQRITAAPTGSTGVVRFAEVPGENVIIGNGVEHDCQSRPTNNYQLCIEGGSFFELDGFTLGGSEQYGVEIANTNPGTTGSRFVTLRNMVGETFRIVGQVSDISVIGGDFGNNTEGSKPQIKKYNPDEPNASRPNNILIEGVQLHDSVCSDGQNCATVDHTECLQLIHSQNITIRKNKFWHCEGTGAIGVTDGPHSTLTIENNIIADVGSPYACQITKNTTNFTLQFNSLGEDCFFSDTDSGGPYMIRGNYGYHHTSLCPSSGVTYEYNVLKGGSCAGTGNKEVSTLDWVNESAGDLHLTSSSNAIGQVASGCIVTDIDGQARPGSGCDAGADEIVSGGGGTPKPGDINGDSSVNIFDLSILLSNYGKTVGQASDPDSDINTDGQIDIFDLSMLLSAYGT